MRSFGDSMNFTSVYICNLASFALCGIDFFEYDLLLLFNGVTVLLITCITRLHSSRMRTARALTVSPSMLCRGGCLVGGCLLRGAVCSLGGGGLLAGVSARGGVCSWGVSALGGVPGQVLPPVDRHMPVNILPCPKLRLRAVKISNWTVIYGERMDHGKCQDDT